MLQNLSPLTSVEKGITLSPLVGCTFCFFSKENPCFLVRWTLDSSSVQQVGIWSRCCFGKQQRLRPKSVAETAHPAGQPTVGTVTGPKRHPTIGRANEGSPKRKPALGGLSCFAAQRSRR